MANLPTNMEGVNTPQAPPLNGNSSVIHLTSSEEKSGSLDESTVISPFRAYLQLWSYSTPIDTSLRTIGAIAAMGAGTALPLMTVVFGNLVNKFNAIASGTTSPSGFRSAINHLSLWFVYLFIGKFVLVYVSSFLYSFTAARIARRIRLQYLKKVLRQPIAFFDSHTPGTIASSLSTDTNVIEIGLGEKVSTCFEALGMVIASFGISFSKSWKLTLVVAVTTYPYIIVTTGLLSSIDTKIEGKSREVLSIASGIAEEALSSMMNVLALGAREKIVNRYRKPVADAARLGFRRGPVQATLYGNMFFDMFVVYALALFYGAKLAAKGEVGSGGAIMTVLFSMIIAGSALGMMSPNIPTFIKAAASAQEMSKLLNQTATNCTQEPRSANITPVVVGGHLRFENITFSYPARPSVSVLDHVSFEAEPKKVTAIVGHSGSGKSTLVGMLERWYEPSSGKTFLDGTEIKDLDINWLRGQIGLVQQEPQLFNDTIFQNVLDGYHGGLVNNLTQQEKLDLVISACKQANAHDFIEELPAGYDTNVGERADNLSGGQKQRIAIARAIISNPKILLLDEATSALDLVSERIVQAALDRASSGRTTLMIAHKMATVEKADRIIVMDNGRIVEEGTHASLVAKQGHYYNLLHSQAFEGSEESGLITPKDRDIEESPKKQESTTISSDQIIPLDSPKISSRISIVKCLWTMLRDNPKIIPSFIIGSLVCIAGGAAFPVQAYLFSKLATVFRLSGSQLISRANFWALMFFILGIANLVSYAILWTFFSIAGNKLTNIYQPNYLSGMLSQTLSFFSTKGNSSGALTSLLDTDGSDLNMLISMTIGLLLVFILDLIMCCFLCLAVGWKLALVGIFACLPALLLAGFMRMRIEFEAQERCSKFFLESSRFGAEAVEAIKTVVSLGLQGKIEEEYKRKLGDAVSKSRKTLGKSMAFYAGSDSMDLLAAGLTFWYGGRLVSKGELSPQTFFIIYTAIINGGQAAGFIFGMSSNLNKAHAAANRILYLTKSHPTTPPPTPIPVPPSSPRPIKLSSQPPPNNKSQPLLQLINTTLTYPTHPTVPILHHISLSLYPSENLIITGPSGSGKSSLINIIENFYPSTTSGSILYYPPSTPPSPNEQGINISLLPPTEWRKNLSLVTQDPFLIQGTIRENLWLGCEFEPPSPTSPPIQPSNHPAPQEKTPQNERQSERETQMQTTCQEIGIHEWITSLPESYSTNVGNRGSRLSGGQRQRISLARAILRVLFASDSPPLTSDFLPPQANPVVDQPTTTTTTSSSPNNPTAPPTPLLVPQNDPDSEIQIPTHHPINPIAHQIPRPPAATRSKRRGTGKILLLDEATSALDRESEKIVVDMIERLVREEGVSVLHVSHQEEVVRRGDRVVCLEGGRVVVVVV